MEVATPKKKVRKRSPAKRAEKRERDIAGGYTDDYTAKRHASLATLAAKLHVEAQQQQQARASMRAREAGFEREMQERERAAAAVLARGQRSERWAQQYVHGEEGEVLPRERYRVSLQAKMVAIGATEAAATRAACQVEAQLLSSVDPSPTVRALSVLPVQSQVWYIQPDKSVLPAVIIAVHTGVPPYYTIAFEDGRERETLRHKLVPAY